LFYIRSKTEAVSALTAEDGDEIVDQEQFGPILPVIRYSDVDEVVARANASPYGLGASVWSGDVDRALTVANRIESGSVWVNQHIAIGPHVPMAGVKSSGLGVEQAEEGLAEYTQLSVISVARGG
jgi:acyl-CoA reductase-like NAD-dependent aldehyde dehydrogenase